MTSRAYLSLCAIYKDEAPYLREWIEFHRLVGAERFFLYDNSSTDDHAAVLGPYLAEGSAVVHEWPSFPDQGGAYEHCLHQHGHESRWIAFIDLDEFLFSPEIRPVSELLTEFEQFPGVGVNRVTLGTSGHDAKPDALVIESYVTAFAIESSIKSIVDPARTLAYRNPHAFVYADDALAVDEQKRPIERWFTSEFTHSKLQINHYYTRSLSEFMVKLEHGRADTGQLREQPVNPAKLGGTIPEDAITAYVPRLRDALARRRSAGEALR